MKNNDKLSSVLPWVDEWVKKSGELNIFADEERGIITKIREKWESVDRIELLNGLKSEYGELVKTSIQKMVRFYCLRDWASLAKEKGDNSLDSFIKTLWNPEEMEGFDFSVDKREDGYQIKCTKCPMAELASEVGGDEWIFLFTCDSDLPMAEGFNPGIKFRRDKTLVTKDGFCNHFYTL